MATLLVAALPLGPCLEGSGDHREESVLLHTVFPEFLSLSLDRGEAKLCSSVTAWLGSSLCPSSPAPFIFFFGVQPTDYVDAMWRRARARDTEKHVLCQSFFPFSQSYLGSSDSSHSSTFARARERIRGIKLQVSIYHAEAVVISHVFSLK